MAVLQIIAKGKVLKALETLRQISGEESVEVLVLKAFAIYQEILAEETAGADIKSQRPNGSSTYLVRHIEDEERARTFFAGKELKFFVRKSP